MRHTGAGLMSRALRSRCPHLRVAYGAPDVERQRTAGACRDCGFPVVRRQVWVDDRMPQQRAADRAALADWYRAEGWI